MHKTSDNRIEEKQVQVQTENHDFAKEISMPTKITPLSKELSPWTGSEEDYSRLLHAIGDLPLVLIGEATHGTHEFYETRAKITQRLIEQKGFKAVAVEADWPDAYRVNRFVQCRGSDRNANESLNEFKRFPRWMWRNEDVTEFIAWLHAHNKAIPDERQRVGFYGLDLYSLSSSMDAVIKYLDEVDPEAAKRARLRYACFEKFGEDPRHYGYAAEFGLTKKCEEEVLKQLQEINAQAYLYLHRDGFAAEDELFYAEQNARVVQNAEEYYRSIFQFGASAWNLRDRYMAKTLKALRKHLQRLDQRSKIVVWEHNSHVGDARATEMASRGELNLGQIMRSRFQSDVFLIGFTTYTGTVAAASEWDAPVEHKHIRPALDGSYEDLFHKTQVPDFLLTFRDHEVSAELETSRLERAIGVIYLPESERVSHYFHAELSHQFDALIHLDTTHAVMPLEKTSEWEKDKVPETYPYGL